MEYEGWWMNLGERWRQNVGSNVRVEGSSWTMIDRGKEGSGRGADVDALQLPSAASRACNFFFFFK